MNIDGNDENDNDGVGGGCSGGRFVEISNFRSDFGASNPDSRPISS